MNKNNFSKFIIIIILLNQAIFAQDDNRALAKIGSEIITVEEFKNRFEFMPHLNYSDTNIDSIKKEFLYSLIAEKLWFLEADELHIDTIETVKSSLQALKNLFVKDELYKQEVESKISISSEEISKGLSCVNRILNTQIITSQDSEKIWNIYKAFQNGAKFDSVITAMRMPQKPFEVRYGSFEDEGVEDILFSLKLNEITRPIKAKDNWFIFKLIDDYPDVSIDLSNDQAKNIVIQKLKDRKSQNLGRVFLDKLLVGKSIMADRRLFDIFSKKLTEVLRTRSGKTEIDSLNNIQLIETDILKVISVMNKDDLNNTFIKFENNPATMNDFLFYLIYQKIYFNSLNTNKVKQIINQFVKRFIEDEIIAREGYKRRLGNLRSVKKDLQIWKEYYLSEVLLNSFSDSIKITNEEIEKYLDRKTDTHNSRLQLNILEILTDNLNDVDKIISALISGKDFKELAIVYNKRTWTKQNDGEWGFFDANYAGEMGKIASTMEVGQIYGPLKVPEGYSIFKLIGKRQQKGDADSTNTEENVKLIRIKMALSKMENLINKKTVSLAKKFGITINEQLLNKVQTSELNTFTYRLIGFGGKIAAFPITIPMFQWYELYLNQKEFP
jgi:parvulin-like peptidyl-prolyl isomerase